MPAGAIFDVVTHLDKVVHWTSVTGQHHNAEWHLWSDYRNCWIGIIDENIKTTVLFWLDLLKQPLDVFILAMITLDWNTFTTSTLWNLQVTFHHKIILLAIEMLLTSYITRSSQTKATSAILENWQFFARNICLKIRLNQPQHEPFNY